MERILTIDIAHPPLDGTSAEDLLNESLKKVHLSSQLRVIKIIHGYGSSGRGGSLKTLAINWAYGNRNRIKCVIAGEGTDTFDADVLQLAQECDLSIRNDLGYANEGMTIIWVK